MPLNHKAAMLSGYSVCLPFAKDGERLIHNLKQGQCVNKSYWFESDEAARKYGFDRNKLIAKVTHDYGSTSDLVCDLIEQALDNAMLDKQCLAGENVRVYLTGLGPRVDVIDYVLFYDHNDIEDVKLTPSVKNLHVSNMTQDKLAHHIAQTYQLKYMPPNLHCTSNSALSAIHLGIQAIESGDIDLVLVINCSEVKTQDIRFLDSQSMLDSDTVQPFGEASQGVLFSEGFGAMVLESDHHRRARGQSGGIALRSTYLQTSGGRSNDSTQLTSSLLKVMNKAMAQTAVTNDDLCAVIPHANGSEASDKAEAQALKLLLGEQIVPVLAYKGQIGYNATGSGIIDLIIGHYSLLHHELLSPVGVGPIRDNIAPYVLLNKGVVKHNKQHLLKLGLGVDGSVIGIVMSVQND